ncbi:hypothetical protein V6N11_002192 [Hibiscus sabdariffa]|uniref:Uncharacterized protein n=1 Tax=Hibiscus sabdariffa TaxID=183260 RepID=A0ABR2QUP9_9ROSI
MPGRPKKKRTKDKDEPVKSKYGKFSREGVKMACSVCKGFDHRKINCPNKVLNPLDRRTSVQNSQSVATTHIQIYQPVATNTKDSSLVENNGPITRSKKRTFKAIQANLLDLLHPTKGANKLELEFTQTSKLESKFIM